MAFSPKTDWQYDEIVTENDLNRIEQGIADATAVGAATDAVIGSRTATDSVTPSFTGQLTPLISSLFTLIKSVTGKSSALTAPAITLESVNGYLDQSVKTGASPTFAGLTLSAPLPIGSGGTGSATKNFVDLTTAQTIVGAKTFSDNVYSSGSFTSINIYPLINKVASHLSFGIHSSTNGNTYFMPSASADATDWDFTKALKFTRGTGAFSTKNNTLDDGNGNVAIARTLTINGGSFVMKQVNNPALAIALDNSGATASMIMNAWGASNNPGITVGTARTDGIAFQVQNAIPMTSNLPSGVGGQMLVVNGMGHTFIGSNSTHDTSQEASNTRRYLSIKGITDAGVLELSSGTSTDGANVMAGQIQFADRNNTSASKRVAGMVGSTDSTGTANARGGLLGFYTRSDGVSGVYQQRVKIDSAGVLRAFGKVAINDDDTATDASLHIKAYSSLGRMTQMHPAAGTVNGSAQNLIASTNGSATPQWWTWGVDAGNVYRINPGTSLNGGGLSINGLGDLTAYRNIVANGTTTSAFFTSTSNVQSDVGMWLANGYTGGRSYLISSGASGSGVGAGAFGIWDESAGLLRYQINASGLHTKNGNLQINGNYTATGTKSAIVPTFNYDDQLLYALESPENRFEDFYEATLDDDGFATIEMDPVFLETVEIYGADYQVQVTGTIRGTYGVSQCNVTNFVVEGEPNATVMCRVTAWRYGYKDLRFNWASVS